jgi:hypothetical protein
MASTAHRHSRGGAKPAAECPSDHQAIRYITDVQA